MTAPCSKSAVELIARRVLSQKPCQSCTRKTFYFSEIEVHCMVCAFRSDQGRTRRHERGAECGGRGMCREMSGAFADGEVVWSWRAHAGAKLSRGSKGFVPMTVANGMVHRGDHEVSRNPSRREGRLSPPVPVVHALAQISFAREPRVHAATRPSLRPLFSMRVTLMHNSGEARRENANTCLSFVIARSVSDEAIQSRIRGSRLLRGACHRAALRADPVARNDGGLAVSKSNLDRLSPSSRRRPGPITPGFCCCEDRRIPSAADKFRSMGPGPRAQLRTRPGRQRREWLSPGGRNPERHFRC